MLDARPGERVLDLGCGEFVVCGGARNAGLVALLQAGEGIRVWRHFEERSAGFFALGRSADSGWPCAVVRAGTSAEGLPIGVQIVGRPWREDVVLALAAHVERALGGYIKPEL